MTERSTYPEDDPRHHTAHLREMLQGLVNHAREDIGKISEPKAQALFETNRRSVHWLDQSLRRLRQEGTSLAVSSAARLRAVHRTRYARRAALRRCQLALKLSSGRRAGRCADRLLPCPPGSMRAGRALVRLVAGPGSAFDRTGRPERLFGRGPECLKTDRAAAPNGGSSRVLPELLRHSASSYWPTRQPT
jgi:hypothetical protein